MTCLVRVAETLPVVDVALHELSQIDTNYWFEAGPPTVRNIVQHVTHAIHEGDSACPVVLGPDDRVMDGMYRIARMLLDDPTHIRAVRLQPLSPPTYVTWRLAVQEIDTATPR